MSQLVVQIGRRFSGKSTTFAKLAARLDRPTLIVDPGRAPVYTEMGFGFIKPEAVAKGFSGVKRISHVINKKKLIATLFGFDPEIDTIRYDQAFTNGNLILEDSASYINSSMTENLRESIKAFKQYGLNLYLSYHSFGEISRDILRLGIDHLILKKTGDSVIFSAISKTRELSNQRGVKAAFYKARFYGLTPNQIKDECGHKLQAVLKDLDPDQFGNRDAKWLSRFANGRVHPTPTQVANRNYHAEWVSLRI